MVAVRKDVASEAPPGERARPLSTSKSSYLGEAIRQRVEMKDTLLLTLNTIHINILLLACCSQFQYQI